MSGPLVAALQAALAGEYAAAFGYGVVGAHTAGSQRLLAGTALGWHTAQQATLAESIRTAGATPVGPEPGYQLPAPVTTVAGAVALAAELEDRMAALYAPLVAAASDRTRTDAADALSACAIRATQWRGRSEPFPGLPGYPD